VVEIVRFYRRVLDQVLAGDPRLDGFEAEWRGLQHRWNTEKRKRDANQIHQALAS
jgi:hypothetical protein